MSEFGSHMKIDRYHRSFMKLCEIAASRGEAASQHIISTNSQGVVIRDYDMNVVATDDKEAIDAITVNQDHLIMGRDNEGGVFAHDFNPITEQITRRFWTDPLVSSQRGSSVVHYADQEYFIVGSQGQNPGIHKIDANDGSVVATWGTTSQLQNSPYNDPFGGANTTLATYLDDQLNLHVFCFHEADGDMWLQKHDPDTLAVDTSWRFITGLSQPSTNISDAGVKITPEGLIIVHSENRVQVYDQDQNKLQDFQPTGSRIKGVGVHQSGDYYTGDTNGMVHKYENGTSNVMYTLDAANLDVDALATDGAGILLIVDGDNVINLYKEDADGVNPSKLGEANNSTSTGEWITGTVHPGERSVLY